MDAEAGRHVRLTEEHQGKCKGLALCKSFPAFHGSKAPSHGAPRRVPGARCKLLSDGDEYLSSVPAVTAELSFPPPLCLSVLCVL